MINAIQPYLHFTDNCKEAMHFYQSVFGGKLEITSIGDSPAKDQFPIELHDQILHSSLIHGQFNIMASDMCGQGELLQGNSIQLSLHCNSEEEIHRLYNKLSEKGTVLSELKKEFWGSLFAMIIDCFGVRWMLSYELQ
ncbi:MAG TPA: VOC family protein [Saprospiraceae bacterium]|nr:VOC family protein [Saprospiraceae bacterium]